MPGQVPTISPHGKNWRAQIRRLGFPPISRTFRTKAEAWSWAEKTERELLSGQYVGPVKHTLGQAFTKYANEVSPTKRGGRWERYRLLSDPFQKAAMAAVAISRVSAAEISAWRDWRLLAVSGATVRREMNLIESVLEVSRKEWRWIAVNHLKDVKKPPNPRSRRRRVSEAEIGMVSDRLTGPSGKEVAAGFRLGIETAMRAGEMWTLGRDQIHLKERYVHLDKTKNGDERDVPLSPTAKRIIAAMLKDGRDNLFTVSLGVRDALFRKARDAAGIENLHFHDSRAEAIWRLSKKLDVLELARVTGHRDIRSLLFYYQSDASELAKKLAGGRPSKPSRPRRSNAAGRSR